MEIKRRTFLEYLTGAAVSAIAAMAGPRGANEMYGLIVRLNAVPGKREEFIGILKEGTAGMPGCLSYVVAGDSVDENAIWVTEVWDSMASHDASLSLPAVKNAVAQAKPLIASFDKVAVTSPVWGVGLRSAHAR
jgi:quinol monooxygenase YgiN